MRINSNNLYFVLVEPQSPGNIGAAARALKTMGFSNFLLVNPADHLADEAQWMAHASADILESAAIFRTLPEALKGMHMVVATTQRERIFHLPFFTPAELVKKAIPVSMEHKVAIVFGREKTGLTNEELGMCDMVSTVPAYTSHPSLNLAQTVMIYAYEFFQAAYGDLKSYHWRLATHDDLNILYDQMQRGLKRVGFEPIDSWENFNIRFSRLMGRANAEKRDVQVWHLIFKSFEKHINQLEAELQRTTAQETDSRADKG
ncbi:MAG: RNA methyltransferase [Calditrichia bacterium]